MNATFAQFKAEVNATFAQLKEEQATASTQHAMALEALRKRHEEDRKQLMALEAMHKRHEDDRKQLEAQHAMAREERAQRAKAQENLTSTATDLASLLPAQATPSAAQR